MCLYLGSSCFFHGFDLIVVLTKAAGVTRFGKCNIKIATLNIKIIPKMCVTGHQTCIHG